MEIHFDDVYRQLDIQMKRMAQIQADLDILTAAVRKQSDETPSASRSSELQRNPDAKR